MRSRSFNLSGVHTLKLPLTFLVGTEQDLTDAPCDHHGLRGGKPSAQFFRKN